MGEEFIRKYTKSFEHRRDLAYEQELKAKSLFSEHPNVCATAYRCRLTAPDVSLQQGDILALMDDGSSSLKLLFGNVFVGEMSESNTHDIRDLMVAEPACHGLANVQIKDGPGLGGYMTVTLVQESE